MTFDIVGKAEHDRFYERFSQKGLLRSELLEFHNEFIHILRNREGCDSFSLDEDRFGREYPDDQRRGIYFCCREVGYPVRSDEIEPSGTYEIWYVGKTNNFEQRWKNHHKREALKVIKYVRVYMLPLEDYSDEMLRCAEDYYILMLNPTFNGTATPDRFLRVAS